MPPPQLTFFNELNSAELTRLFRDPGVASFLADGGHALAMGLLDLTPERAAIVRELEARAVPVTAWILLDVADGYWLHADNIAAARKRCAETLAWAEGENLRLHRIGLDIEPARADVESFMRQPGRTLLRLLRQRRSRDEIEGAEHDYAALVAELRAGGRSVEAYQVPFMFDERRAGTFLLRRCLGILDVECDVEVPMLYSTYLGERLARSYFAEAEAIALGVTGGGVNADDPREQRRRLGWSALERQLRTASTSSDRLYVFSLEGCVWNGFLSPFGDIDWEQPLGPAKADRRAARVRALLRACLRSEGLLDWILPSVRRRA